MCKQIMENKQKQRTQQMYTIKQTKTYLLKEKDKGGEEKKNKQKQKKLCFCCFKEKKKGQKTLSLKPLSPQP